MYQEAAQPVEPQIAGLLLSAILSDTLKFQSPTCTPLDRITAEKLAATAGVDMDDLAQAMFEAGEALDGKTPEEVFHQDYKTFDHGALRLGVGQGSFISRGNYEKAQAMISEFLPQAQPQLGVDMAFYLLTSLQDQSSLVLSAGAGAQSLLCRAFRAEAGENGVLLPGVVSRKKQFIPQLLRALQEEL
jgi:manganese-dependent inorganic pyrophosphatase